jgi:hypothetical protein
MVMIGSRVIVSPMNASSAMISQRNIALFVLFFYLTSSAHLWLARGPLTKCSELGG